MEKEIEKERGRVEYKVEASAQVDAIAKKLAMIIKCLRY